MTRGLSLVCAALGAGLLAAAFFGLGYPLPGYAILLVGLAWMAAVFLHREWVTVPALCVYYGFAAAGFYLRAAAGPAQAASTWMLLAGGLSALLAGDLADFAARLEMAAPDDDVHGLKRHHYLQLAIMASLGMLLSIAALSVQVEFSFELSLVLIVLGVWGISRVIRRLLKQGSD